MKFVLLLAVFAGAVVFAVNVAPADDVNFTGEWVVDSDEGGSGITVTINVTETVDAPQTWTPSGQVYIMPDGTQIFRTPTLNSKASTPRLSRKSYNVTLIPAGAFFDFAVNGTQLTGFIIRGETEEPIFDGKINGNKITFTVREIIKEQTWSYSYTGELLEDSIRFDVKPPRNGGDGFKFTARRVSR